MWQRLTGSRLRCFPPALLQWLPALRQPATTNTTPRRGTGLNEMSVRDRAAAAARARRSHPSISAKNLNQHRRSRDRESGDATAISARRPILTGPRGNPASHSVRQRQSADISPFEPAASGIATALLRNPPSNDSATPPFVAVFASEPVPIIPEMLGVERFACAGFLKVTLLMSTPARRSPAKCPVTVNPAIDPASPARHKSR